MNDYKEKPFKDGSQEGEGELSQEQKDTLDRLNADHKRLLDGIKEGLAGRVDDVVFSAKLVDSPVCITTKEGLSMNAERVLNEEPGEHTDEVRSSKVLEINPDHDLFKALSTLTSDEDIKNLASILYDEAMLLQGYEIEDKATFVQKLNTLLIKASKAG